MLHAYNRRKSKLYSRYQNVKSLLSEDEDRKIPAEDELTSTIIGPMDFLQSNDIYLFWSKLITTISPISRDGGQLPVTAPSSVEHHFWPRRRGTEPDVMINLRWPNGERRILLVEIKWRSGLSGDDQLHRQWVNFLEPAERAISIHIFISLREHDFSFKKNKGNDGWPETKLVTLTWMQWKRELENCKRTNSFSVPFKNWADVACDLLEKLDVTHFRGFRNMQPPTLSDTNAPTIFWNPEYFTQLPDITPIPNMTEAFYFNNRRTGEKK